MGLSRSLGPIAVALGVVVAWPLAAQEPHPTFRAGVSRVTLNVVVRDGHGRAITGLTNADFQVLDQGRAVQISDFRTGEEPVSLAILVDTSGSMRLGDRLTAAKYAAETLLNQLRSDDEAALFTFETSLHDVVPFSHDLAAVQRGFDRIVPFGSTSLHDAVAAAARRVAAQPSLRRAVVAITDGFDNSSRLTAAAASEVAGAIDVPVYVLAVADTSQPGDTSEVTSEPVEGGGVARLDDLTRWTGGASMAADTPTQAAASVHQIIGDLRSGYVLAFEPERVSGWHQLTVRVARKGATVRTRAGFWMSAPGARASGPGADRHASTRRASMGSRPEA
ncbi:MAG TPA: VWA domain-containing protein [Vicinamibacterales bacterium]|nr:VWA domain-containing protein [Vicinamibacterales bacterium]